MTLFINSQHSLNEIRERFTRYYPSVKIEFSFNGNEPLNHAVSGGKPFPFLRLEELFPESSKEMLSIQEDMTIGEVESLFWKHFGLPVQLYIRKGGYWLKNTLHNAVKLVELQDQ